MENKPEPKQLTDVELRQQILDLQKKNEELTTNYNTVNDQLKTRNEEVNSLNGKISELKQTNYDLFIQVSSPLGDKSDHQNTNVNQQVETQQTKAKSLNEIATLLGGKK